jgi:hypothetical protein
MISLASVLTISKKFGQIPVLRARLKVNHILAILRKAAKIR